MDFTSQKVRALPLSFFILLLRVSDVVAAYHLSQNLTFIIISIGSFNTFLLGGQNIRNKSLRGRLCLSLSLSIYHHPRKMSGLFGGD